MKLPPIIQIEDFAKIQNQENILLIEAGSSRENYAKKHLENAFYLDLNEDLSKVPENPKNGGRHPLPKIKNFAETLQKIGAKKDSHFIIYDDKNGANAAARLWWMLRSVGLQNNVEEVKDSSIKKDKIIIDVRETARYNGETEPIDLVAGHIPNAINIPFATNLDENGLFKSPKILKTYYSQFLENKKLEDIIVHCGSGVTACHTLLAMDYAGLEIPNLFVGSWSEWSRNELPIERYI